MKCNAPQRAPPGHSKKFVVKACDKGVTKKVSFGDRSMTIKKHLPAHRASFRARHKCDEKKDKFTPGYWSCKMW